MYASELRMHKCLRVALRPYRCIFLHSMTSRTWRTFRDLCEEASVQHDVPKLEKLAKQIARILDSEAARLKLLSAKSAKSR
jgi:hypothetical protein